MHHRLHHRHHQAGNHGGKYESILRREGQFFVYQDPNKHLANANGYSRREILLLILIGVERVRRQTGNQYRGPTHPAYNMGINSPINLEKVFWRENPDGGIVYSNTTDHLNQAQMMSNRELVAFALIGIERVASRNLGQRMAAPLSRYPGGKFEEIFFRENPHGGHCYTKPLDGLYAADHMSQREVLAFILIGMERLHAKCVRRIY